MSTPPDPYAPYPGQPVPPAGTSGTDNPYGAAPQPGQPPVGSFSGYPPHNGEQFPGYAHGYGTQPVTQLSGGPAGAGIDAVDSLGQGMKALFKNILPWISAQLMYSAISIVVAICLVLPVALIESGNDRTAVNESGMSALSVFTIVFVYLMLIVVNTIWFLNMHRNAVRQVRGEKVTFGDFFLGRGLGAPLGTFLLVSLIVAVGLILLVIPGLIAGFFLLFALLLVWARPQEGIRGALRQSMTLAKQNPGATFLLVVFCILLSAVGSALIFGGIITGPLSACILAHAALRGSGERLVRWP